MMDNLPPNEKIQLKRNVRRRNEKVSASTRETTQGEIKDLKSSERTKEK